MSRLWCPWFWEMINEWSPQLFLRCQVFFYKLYHYIQNFVGSFLLIESKLSKGSSSDGWWCIFRWAHIFIVIPSWKISHQRSESEILWSNKKKTNMWSWIFFFFILGLINIIVIRFLSFCFFNFKKYNL